MCQHDNIPANKTYVQNDLRCDWGFGPLTLLKFDTPALPQVTQSPIVVNLRKPGEGILFVWQLSLTGSSESSTDLYFLISASPFFIFKLLCDVNGSFRGDRGGGEAWLKSMYFYWAFGTLYLPNGIRYGPGLFFNWCCVVA